MDLRPARICLTLVLALLSSWRFRVHEPTPATLLAVLTFFSAIQLVSHLWTDCVSLQNAIGSASLHGVVYLLGLAAFTVEYRMSSRHPLASIPGPRLAKVTKWFMAYYVLKGNRHLEIQRLHNTYGLWVRIGPNEVSLNEASAIKPIYLNLPRASSYRGVPTHDETLIMLVDRAHHAKRRKPWTRAFSPSMLASYSVATNIRAAQLVQILQREKTVDFHHWVSLSLMDIIGDLGFSGGIETLSSGVDTEGWLKILNLGALVVGLISQVPWTRDIVLLFPQKGPIQTFHKFAKTKVALARSNTSDVPGNPNILSTILRSDGTIATSAQPELSENEAAADASLLLASSIETTSQALTTLVRYVLADKSVLQRVSDEIMSVFPDTGTALIVTAQSFHSTPFLNACIQEALRIMPPAPAGLPRTTGLQGTTVLGKFVPPQTTIHVPTYSVQRDSTNFADSERYIPTRWLVPERDLMPHNDSAFIPFGVGFGSCVGRQLALQNIRIIAVHLFRNLDLRFARGFSLSAFDASYQDRTIWTHDCLMIDACPKRDVERQGLGH